MKKIITFLFAVPLISFAQTKDNWQLYNGSERIASGVNGHIIEVQISKTDINTIKLRYLSASFKKGWNNTFIIMDTNRVEIERKKITSTNNYIIFYKKNLLVHKKLVAYVTSIPSNPKQAAKIKVGTVSLVSIKLVD
jgi:hypothetical protein